MNLRKPLLAALALVWLTPSAWAEHHDETPSGSRTGPAITGVAPIYLYNSAGAAQFISAGTLASATGLTVPTGATIAQICVETAGVRYRDDGVAPTSSVGMPLVATSTVPACFQYAGPLGAIQFIAISGSPTMDVSYYYAN